MSYILFSGIFIKRGGMKRSNNSVTQRCLDFRWNKTAENSQIPKIRHFFYYYYIDLKNILFPYVLKGILHAGGDKMPTMRVIRPLRHLTAQAAINNK